MSPRDVVTEGKDQPEDGEFSDSQNSEEEDSAESPPESADLETITQRKSADDLAPDDPLSDDLADVLTSDPHGLLSDPANLLAAIEAMLFASPEALSAKKITDALECVEIDRVREALGELSDRLREENRGLQVIEVAGGYQMSTREEYAEFIYRLKGKKKRQTLSSAALETLAIIAYRQPVIRAVVESIRGVESSGTMRNLLDMNMIKVVGHKEVIGRPSMYGTTDDFLKAFGLTSLEELPDIHGLKEQFIAEQEERERKEAEKRREEEEKAREEAEAAAAQLDADATEEESGEAASDQSDADDPDAEFDDDEFGDEGAEDENGSAKIIEMGEDEDFDDDDEDDDEDEDFEDSEDNAEYDEDADDEVEESEDSDDTRNAGKAESAEKREAGTEATFSIEGLADRIAATVERMNGGKK